jgi:hypothetical protein
LLGKIIICYSIFAGKHKFVGTTSHVAFGGELAAMQVIFIDNYFRTFYLDFCQKEKVKRVCFWK